MLLWLSIKLVMYLFEIDTIHPNFYELLVCFSGIEIFLELISISTIFLSSLYKIIKKKLRFYYLCTK